MADSGVYFPSDLFRRSSPMAADAPDRRSEAALVGPMLNFAVRPLDVPRFARKRHGFTGFALRRFVLKCCVAAVLVGLFGAVSGRGQVGWDDRTASGAERSALEAALNSITAGELQNHVNVLADDTFEGREAGSRGGRAAAGYLVKHFQQAGLKPLGDRGGFYQAFGAGCHNLLAVVEGSDPKLKDQYVVVGGHYDHVGYGSRTTSFGPIGYIHNGADDNASGTACILELIDAVKMLPEPPRRSILFALWDGEEKGLLGSQHWLANPTVPLAQVVFAVNIDMVGRLRNDKLEMCGSRTARGLRRLIGQQNQSDPLDIDFSWEMKANSDHHPFFARSIPVIMFHTGLHEDYHRPSDDAHKLNPEGIQRVTRLVFRTVVEVADAATAPAFRAESRRETPALREQFEAVTPPPRPRLGARWLDAEPGQGVKITSVNPGSPAERAGLDDGDHILKINDDAVTSADKLRLKVLAARSPLSLVVRKAGKEEPQTMSVPIDGQPLRLGVTWREDESEPGSILITMVVPASAAWQAGLQPRDRVYAVNGQPFKSGEEFLQMVTTNTEPAELLVDRRGKLSTMVLPVP